MKGYIFDSAYIALVSVENQKERYTPSEEDIRKAESIIKEKLKDANKQRINQTDNCPVIHKNLKKYMRQYVGFLNNDGQKIIWVNMIWKDKGIKDLGKEIITVLDGCSYYWNVKINLSEESLYDLDINGLG